MYLKDVVTAIVSGYRCSQIIPW